MATFKEDYSFGTKSEETNHKVIEEFLKTSLIHKGGMSVFDFCSPDKMVHADLKTRRITHDKFPTAIIGGNKVMWAENNPKSDYWFIYNYLDGFYGVQYEKELFDTFEKSMYQRGERSDYSGGAQMCYFIPHKHLQKIN